MDCAKPFIVRGGAFPCGNCLPCRIKKRRIWTHRIMLESALHEHNAFVTLTYDEENYPEDHSVHPSVLSAFIKRLRKHQKVRFYGVGEYGDETGRPHYHLALFGFQSCEYGITQKKEKCCPRCDLIRTAWGKGQVMLAQLEPQSAAYICGYVVKKMTRDDDQRLEGRLPEFARMSLRPGIGADMMDEVASTFMQHGLDKTETDVPVALQHGKKSWPLGRYLRRRLRERVGRDKNAPSQVYDKNEALLLPMRQAAWANQKPLSEVYQEETKGRRTQIAAAARRFRKRGSI